MTEVDRPATPAQLAGPRRTPGDGPARPHSAPPPPGRQAGRLASFDAHSRPSQRPHPSSVKLYVGDGDASSVPETAVPDVEATTTARVGLHGAINPTDNAYQLSGLIYACNRRVDSIPSMAHTRNYNSQQEQTTNPRQYLLAQCLRVTGQCATDPP